MQLFVRPKCRKASSQPNFETLVKVTSHRTTNLKGCQILLLVAILWLNLIGITSATNDTFANSTVANDTTVPVRTVPVPPAALPEESFLSQDGFVILVVFDKFVDVFLLRLGASESCAKVFDSKLLSDLHVSHCLWSSRRQVHVFLREPLISDFVQISFNTKLLRVPESPENNAEIATRFEITEAAGSKLLGSSNNSLIVTKKSLLDAKAEVKILGPTSVPNCGMFALTAQIYSPRGAWDATYRWEVAKLPAGRIADSLAATVRNAANATLLLFPQEHFDQFYRNFKFKVFVRLKSAEKLQAEHQLIKFARQTPIVTVYETEPFLQGDTDR